MKRFGEKLRFSVKYFYKKHYPDQLNEIKITLHHSMNPIRKR